MRHPFLLLLCLSFCLCAMAQKAGIRITESTVVRDSASGTVYPAAIWRQLMMSGDYSLRPADPKDAHTEFLLVLMTEEQKNMRMQSMARPRESGFFTTGKDFSAFKTVDINNSKINIKEEKGKVIVLNFWFINCPPCRAEIPALNELADQYKGNDSVHFIAIALDDKYSIREFLKSMPFNYDIVHEGRYIAERYGIRSYPTHVVIDQSGKVYFHTTGLAPNTVSWLKKSITELLSQPAVAKQ